MARDRYQLSRAAGSAHPSSANNTRTRAPRTFIRRDLQPSTQYTPVPRALPVAAHFKDSRAPDAPVIPQERLLEFPQAQLPDTMVLN